MPHACWLRIIAAHFWVSNLQIRTIPPLPFWDEAKMQGELPKNTALSASSLYSQYDTKELKEWRGPSPRLSARTTQLWRNAAATATMRPTWTARASNPRSSVPISSNLYTKRPVNTLPNMKKIIFTFNYITNLADYWTPLTSQRLYARQRTADDNSWYLWQSQQLALHTLLCCFHS